MTDIATIEEASVPDGETTAAPDAAPRRKATAKSTPIEQTFDVARILADPGLIMAPRHVLVGAFTDADLGPDDTLTRTQVAELVAAFKARPIDPEV